MVEDNELRYALNLPNGGPCADARSMGELAALAEASGWDGVFLEDYLVYQNREDVPTYDPWILLAVMAVRTERIRLGVEVTPLVRRRPWKAAKEAVTLDHLSNGRLTLGIGLGGNDDLSFTRFGEPSSNAERAAMLDEALDILAGLWSGEPFSHQGTHYSVGEVTFLPCPVQSPRIPIWIGGGYPLRGPMQRAVRWDGACLYRQSPDSTWRDWTPEELRNLKTFIRGQRGTMEAFDIVVGGRERGEDWEQERRLIASLAEAGATWWVEWVPPADPDVMRAAVERGPLRA